MCVCPRLFLSFVLALAVLFSIVLTMSLPATLSFASSAKRCLLSGQRCRHFCLSPLVSCLFRLSLLLRPFPSLTFLASDENLAISSCIWLYSRLPLCITTLPVTYCYFLMANIF